MDTTTFVQSNQSTQDEIEEDVLAKKKSACYRIVRNRKYQLWVLFLFFTISVPLMFYVFMFHNKITDTTENFTCTSRESWRVPCGEVNVTSEKCLDMDCCYDHATLQCYHYYPSKYRYKPTSDDGVYYYSPVKSPFASSALLNLKMSVAEVDENILRIAVYDVETNVSESTIDEKNYYLIKNENMLAVDVYRNNDERLLTTGIGPLVASDTYWEWTFFLSSDLFGMDELYFENNVTTINKILYKNKNDSTTLPAFMAYINGRYHGLVVENEGPMELIVLPSKLIVMRSLGGGSVSLTLVTGPTPKDVMFQLRNFEFVMPPQWVLEPHICRSGSTDLFEAIAEYLIFIEKNNAIQYASDCFHEDLYFLLYSANESVKASVTDALTELQRVGKFLLTVPPQILINDEYPLYALAENLDLLYRNATGGLYSGIYADQQVAYPDFTSPSVENWVNEMLKMFDDVKIDGFVLADNYPADDSFEMEKAVEEFPYFTEDFQSSMSFTLAWNATTPENITHFKVHNSYSHQQVELFKSINSVVFTSTYSYGMDAIVQQRNVNASWTNLINSIKKTLSHGIFGHPLISFPVCGSTADFDVTILEVLCMRWYITAATMPMFTILSDVPRRDPLSLGSGHAFNVAIDAIEKRNAFMPYYLTVLNRGEPIARPMFFDFHDDTETFVLKGQYMVGDALLAAQVLLLDKFALDVYLPPDAGVWYEFFGGQIYDEDLGWIRLPVVNTDWIMFIAQGKIVPLKNVKSDEDEESYTLAVALEVNDEIWKASGSLFLSSVSLEFEAGNLGVTIGNIRSAKEDIGCTENVRNFPSVVKSFRIYGLDGRTMLWSDFIAVDLCEVIADEYFINYFI